MMSSDRPDGGTAHPETGPSGATGTTGASSATDLAGLAAPDLVRDLLARWVLFHEAAAERLGLNATDLTCLELLRGESPITPTRLADLSGLTTGAVTGVIDRLEKAGLVRRAADPRDRRSVTVSLVSVGGGSTAAAFASLEKATAELLARFDQKERTAIREYVARLADLLVVETERLRVSARGGLIGDTFTAPLGGATIGRLVFASGAPRFAWRAAPLGPSAVARVVVETSSSRLRLLGGAPPADIVRARFDGPAPDISVRDGVVTMRYKRLPVDWRSRGATIELNGSIPWSIEVQQGLSNLDADLRDLPFVGLEVRGGVDNVTMTLPEPVGTVPLRIAGGAREVTFVRPRNVGLRIHVAGGTSHLKLDDHGLGGSGDEALLQSDDYATASERYEIDISGGVNEVSAVKG